MKVQMWVRRKENRPEDFCPHNYVERNLEGKEDGRKREEDPDEGEDRQGCLQIHQQGNQEEVFQVKMSGTARNCPTLGF